MKAEHEKSSSGICKISMSFEELYCPQASLDQRVERMNGKFICIGKLCWSFQDQLACVDSRRSVKANSKAEAVKLNNIKASKRMK